MNSNDDRQLIRLREEILDFSKKTVHSGEVICYKEISTEEIKIEIPLVKEEIVIEKRVFDPQHHEINKTETIRIPISKEEYKIIKNKVILADVDIYTRQLQDVQQIKTTLHKEILKIKHSPK